MRLVLRKRERNSVPAKPAPYRSNIRDPLAERLIGPGKGWEIETVMVRGREQEVFKGRPRNLAGLFRNGLAFGGKDMIVFGEESFTYAEGFARAAALAKALREQFGVGPGTKVAVAMTRAPLPSNRSCI